MSQEGFRDSLGQPLEEIKDEEEEDEFQLNTGQRRELDTLQSKAIQSRVISEFLRKKEDDRKSYD